MAVPDRFRRRLIVLLVVAIGFLVARIVAVRVGTAPRVQQALYALAVLSLVVAVLLVLRHRLDR